MRDKLRKVLFDFCDLMEIVLAIFVIVGILIATLNLFPGMLKFWENKGDTHAFIQFLDLVFSVVIGIEFLKMLCRPNTANIIEVLIFVSSRHLIMEAPGAKDTLLYIVGICILFVFRRLMLATKPDKDGKIPNILKAIKIAQTKTFQEALNTSSNENGD